MEFFLIYKTAYYHDNSIIIHFERQEIFKGAYRYRQKAKMRWMCRLEYLQRRRWTKEGGQKKGSQFSYKKMKKSLNTSEGDKLNRRNR